MNSSLLGSVMYFLLDVRCVVIPGVIVSLFAINLDACVYLFEFFMMVCVSES